MQVLSFIKKIDFLGNSINFTINSNEKFKTVFGGFISFFLYISYIYLFIILGKDYLLKENPKGNFQLKQNKNPKIRLKELDFIVGFRLVNFNFNPINMTKYFHPYFTFTENFYKNNNSSYTDEFIEAISCDKIPYPNKLNENNFDLSSYICPNMNNITDKFLGGSHDFKENTTEIMFYLSICKNQSEECRDPKEFKKDFMNEFIFIEFIYPEVTYSIDNYTNPFNVKLKSQMNFLNYRRVPFNSFSFSSYELEDDNGNFFENINYQNKIGISNIIQYDDHKEEVEDFKNDKNFTLKESTYFFCAFSFDKNSLFFSRSYLKFPDVYANVSGLMDLFILFISLFYSIFNKFRLDTYLCNRLIFIEEENALDFKGNNINYSLKERLIIQEDIKKYLNIKHNNSNYIKEIIENINENNNINNTKQLKKSNEIEIKKEENLINNINKYSNIKLNLNVKDNNDDNNNNLSDRNLFEKNENQNQNQEKFKSYTEMIFNKFKELKNKINFKIFDLLISIGNKNYKYKSISKLYEIYSEKFNEKFDIFYYMKLDKKIELNQKILFDKDQIKIIDFISNKNFKVSLNKIDNENFNNKIEENYDLIIEKLIKRNLTLDSKEKNIKALFLF
jgi:hypothetical protein